jgi:hypothetical protein
VDSAAGRSPACFSRASSFSVQRRTTISSPAYSTHCRRLDRERDGRDRDLAVCTKVARACNTERTESVLAQGTRFWCQRPGLVNVRTCQLVRQDRGVVGGTFAVHIARSPCAVIRAFRALRTRAGSCTPTRRVTVFKLRHCRPHIDTRGSTAEPRRERPLGRPQGHTPGREPGSFTSRFRTPTPKNR